MHPRPKTTGSISFYLVLTVVLAACGSSLRGQDAAVEAARKACGDLTGLEQYDCYERAAVVNLNPEICRLVGISIDDMCLQAVYEAAGDPSICERLYLQGVVPTCREYYARRTPSANKGSGTPEKEPSAGLAPTHNLRPSPTLTPTLTPTFTPTSTAIPTTTPLFVFDLSKYDADIFQPIDLSHNPPLIARSDETVRLAFFPVNTIYCERLKRYCRLEPRLYAAYGEVEAFQSVPFNTEIVEGMESLVTRLPATDAEGRSLRYYAEFSLPEAGYSLRYPPAGTIDLFAADSFIPVDLPVEKAVEPGEVVYPFFWGFGADKVRSTTYDGYPARVGPQAMDVAQDGRIALLDGVNERIMVYDPNEELYTSLPLPFPYQYYGLEDLQFDENGQLAVLDLSGEAVEGSPYSIAQCYRLDANGEVSAAAPVYVKQPSKFTPELTVLDQYDYRLVSPFDAAGDANSREDQRQKETWDLPYRFLEGKAGLDAYAARFADVKTGIAFEVHSASPLGTIMDFARTPQGYLMAFFLGDRIRAVWIDLTGIVLKDITLPNGQYSEVNFNGQAAVAPDGSLYVLSSTRRGIEIHYAAAP